MCPKSGERGQPGVPDPSIPASQEPAEPGGPAKPLVWVKAVPGALGLWYGSRPGDFVGWPREEPSHCQGPRGPQSSPSEMTSPLLRGTRSVTQQRRAHPSVHVAEPHLRLAPLPPGAPSAPPVLLCSTPGTLHSPGTVGRVHRLRSFTKPRFQLASGTPRSLHVVRAKAADAQRFTVSEQ